MPQCAVATCRNSHRRTRGRRIRYHRFPQIPEVRARWVRACGRAPLSNGDIPFNIQTARICSLHFTNDSYEKDMEHLVLGLPVRSRLRRGAVPTIGVPVNVQPITKFAVDDKRSILKVTRAKILDNAYYPKLHAENDDINRNGNQERKYEQKMAGIDVLLALGLKPAPRLNKMHAIDNATTSPGNGKSTSDKKDEDASTDDSPKVPHNRQNGAALPEETTTVASVTRVKHLLVSGASIKKENHSDCDDVLQVRKKKPSTSGNSNVGGSRAKDIIRKRRSTEDNAFSTNGNPKRICFEQRERFIDSLVGSERIGAEELATRADELRAEVQALDELARAKEMEWNEILSMRKLKEEAYLRVERRRQVMGFLESNNGQMADCLPPASLSLHPEWEQLQNDMSQERPGAQESPDGPDAMVDSRLISRSRVDSGREDSPTAEDEIVKRDDESMSSIIKSQRIRSGSSAKHIEDSLRKQRCSAEQNLDQRHIGEGRQGPIVDVKSIIADYRLRHPETVPRRGRRMRNSVNIGLGAGGAMVETGHGQDSRASSTDSCKSNPTNSTDAMSFKDVLVQFAKLSQQQGEPVKTPQNYPDVTLHPVAPSPVISTNSPASQQPTGSLLHGILTKSQSPRPATFSPTLARLLTAPERDRSTPPTALSGQQAAQAQHLLQTYQGSNPVSISDLLSSSKARTEITITPVVNPSVQSTHSNNTVHIDEVEEENSLIEERDTRRSGRDNRDDRDSPPRCQGCHERAAQFVCAGCGNQWYCSRECQVSAWDEHSEVCSG